MREADNNSLSIYLSVVGVYAVRTSSLNDNHSCQLYNKFEVKTTPTSTTPLIMANTLAVGSYHLLQSCLATIFSSLALLSLSVSVEY